MIFIKTIEDDKIKIGLEHCDDEYEGKAVMLSVHLDNATFLDKIKYLFGFRYFNDGYYQNVTTTMTTLQLTLTELKKRSAKI
jgi:hypothetical protein